MIRSKVRMPALPTFIHWRSWLQQLIMKKDIKEIQIDKEFKISLFTYGYNIYTKPLKSIKNLLEIANCQYTKLIH